MKEPHSEGVAKHADLESCAGAGENAGEALTEALAGRRSSREIRLSGADPVDRRGRQHRPSRYRKRRANPARSQNPCTSGNSPHQNRESSAAPAAKWQPGGERRKPRTCTAEQPELEVVAMNDSNKSGTPPAESREGSNRAQRVSTPTSNGHARTALGSGQPCPRGWRACGKQHDGRQRGSSLRCCIISRWSFCAAAFMP